MSDNFTGATTSHCLPLRPGTRHVYHEQNTGESVILEVRSAGVNIVSIGGRLPNGKNAVVHVKSDRPSGSNLDTARLWVTKADTGSGLVLTFGPEGLALPMNLIVGETITAEPAELNPATGGKLALTFRVEGIEKIKVRPELALDQEAGFLVRQGIRCTMIVTDVKLGMRLAKIDLWLLPGLGLVRSTGQAFGPSTILDLVEFHTPA